MVRHTETASDLVGYADRHGIDLLSDRFEFNREREDIPTDVHLLTGTTPDGGELVIVDKCVPTGDGWEVTLVYPERDPIDGDTYTRTSSVESFFARMNADGGWYEVPTAVRAGTVNCPICGSFMTVHEGREGFDGDESNPWFAWAGCRCGHDVGHDYLVDEGAVVELLI